MKRNETPPRKIACFIGHTKPFLITKQLRLYKPERETDYNVKSYLNINTKY